MKDSARCQDRESSDEGCRYMWRVTPGLILGGCHGLDEKRCSQSCTQEAIALAPTDGKPLPPPTAGREPRPGYNKMQDDETDSAKTSTTLPFSQDIRLEP